MRWCTFIFSLLSLVVYISDAKITLEDIKNCQDLDNHILQFKDVKIATKNDKTQFTGDIIYKDNIGDNYYATVEVFASMSGKKFVKIMTQKDNDPCKGVKKHLGAVWEEIQKNAKMPVGECPLKKGTYHINTSFDLSKMPLPIPPGSLKIVINGYNKNNKTRAYCGEIKIKSD